MLSQYWPLLRENRSFRRLWAAQIVSEIGDWFYSIAIYTLLLQLTGHATAVGLALMLQMLPQTFAGPAAGVINDRLPRKHVMVFADLVRMFVVLSMLLVRSADMIWLAYVALGVETVMAALFEPARSAVLPNLVSNERLLAANTLMATTWSFNLAIGAALGGAVALALGRDAVFVINGASFLLSAILILPIRLEERHVDRNTPFHARDLVDFRPLIEGVRYIRHDARLTVMVFLKCGMGMLGASWVLYPVFGERIFNQSLGARDPNRAAVIVTSVLMAARGAGALVGPIVSSGWVGARMDRVRVAVTFGFLGGSAGYFLFAGAPSLALACLAVIIAHAGTSSIWVNSTTLLQMNTEDRFRGRVFAADLGLCMLSISMTSYIAGRLIDFGVAPRFIALGTAILMLAPTAVWLAAQRLWREPVVVSGHG
jgi:MFS family permease